MKWRGWLILIGVILVVVACYFAFRAFGWQTPLALLAGLLGGAGAVTGMRKVKRDPGRPARGDLGARGVEQVKVKTPDGKTKIEEKRRTPRRGGGTWF